MRRHPSPPLVFPASTGAGPYKATGPELPDEVEVSPDDEPPVEELALVVPEDPDEPDDELVSGPPVHAVSAAAPAKTKAARVSRPATGGHVLPISVAGTLAAQNGHVDSQRM